MQWQVFTPLIFLLAGLAVCRNDEDAQSHESVSRGRAPQPIGIDVSLEYITAVYAHNESHFEVLARMKTPTDLLPLLMEDLPGYDVVPLRFTEPYTPDSALISLLTSALVLLAQAIHEDKNITLRSAVLAYPYWPRSSSSFDEALSAAGIDSPQQSQPQDDTLAVRVQHAIRHSNLTTSSTYGASQLMTIWHGTYHSSLTEWPTHEPNLSGDALFQAPPEQGRHISVGSGAWLQLQSMSMWVAQAQHVLISARNLDTNETTSMSIEDIEMADFHELIYRVVRRRFESCEANRTAGGGERLEVMSFNLSSYVNGSNLEGYLPLEAIQSVEDGFIDMAARRVEEHLLATDHMLDYMQTLPEWDLVMAHGISPQGWHLKQKEIAETVPPPENLKSWYAPIAYTMVVGCTPELSLIAQGVQLAFDNTRGKQISLLDYISPCDAVAEGAALTAGQRRIEWEREQEYWDLGDDYDDKYNDWTDLED